MENKQIFRPNPKLKLMEQVREVLRYHHYAYRTEQTYRHWIGRYIHFFGDKIHPKNLGARDVERFLSDLAVKKKVSVSTQKQALNAIIFLYRKVLDKPLDWKIAHALMARLLYGSGLRLMECVRLRIKDIDFDRKRIKVLGKGDKWRSTILATPVIPELQAHMERVKALHHADLEEGYGEVYLPSALARKYPRAARETSWQYLFPAKKRSIDPRSGRERRHHVLESGLQKAVKLAAKRAGIDKRVTCHTLRHSFATAMLEKGINIRVLQDLLGHADVKTTEMYTHVMDKDIYRLTSPLEDL